jgi:hypothetical protein
MLSLLLKIKPVRSLIYFLKKRRMVASLQQAIASAKETTGGEGKKCLIYKIDGEYKVVTKGQLRNMKRNGAFKGLSYREIEKRALMITR